MEDSEAIFSEAFGRFWSNWSYIMSLRQVAEVALPIAREALTPIHAQAVDTIAADPEYSKLFIKLDGTQSPWNEKLKEFLCAGMTNTAIANSRAAIDAASLVFAQSMLDDSAWSYCRVCALIAPKDWEQFLEKKTVDYASVRDHTADAIRDELLTKKLKELEYKSLLEKVGMLFRLCKPPANFAPIEDYTFDQKRLEAIDNRRNQIIHGNGIKVLMTDLDSDLEFVRRTSHYLMAMVNQRFGLRLHPYKVFPQPPTLSSVSES
ncbi:MAG: hypothetical protein ABSC48_15545 [Terracidiphilus sp.]